MVARQTSELLVVNEAFEVNTSLIHGMGGSGNNQPAVVVASVTGTEKVVLGLNSTVDSSTLGGSNSAHSDLLLLSE